MRYDVRLTLHYDYGAGAGAGRHHVRVLPKEIAGVQRVEAASLSFSPQPGERADFTDFFGTTVAAIAFREPHDALDVRMSARVSVTRPAPGIDLSPDLETLRREVAETMSLAPQSPQPFLAGHLHTGIEPRLTAYAERSAGAGSVLTIARDICARIHRDFAYDGDATSVSTRAAEAFDLKRGVCQDFSHVMIAGLRGLGIPAGYVSGFLRTIAPPGKARLEGADAMHAWVKIWCGRQTGWVELDPTNDMPAGDDHIVVGYGRDYADVAPIVGVFRTSGGQEGDQKVDVVPIEPAAPAADAGK